MQILTPLKMKFDISPFHIGHLEVIRICQPKLLEVWNPAPTLISQDKVPQSCPAV